MYVLPRTCLPSNAINVENGGCVWDGCVTVCGMGVWLYMGWVCGCVRLQLLPGSSGWFGLVVLALELEICVPHISMQGG